VRNLGATHRDKFIHLRQSGIHDSDARLDHAYGFQCNFSRPSLDPPDTNHSDEAQDDDQTGYAGNRITNCPLDVRHHFDQKMVKIAALRPYED
jgi:hypothetical protein